MTTDTSTPEYLDFIARVRRSNAETEKFIEEAHKLRAEEGKLLRERALYPMVVAASTVTALAAAFGAGIAFTRLFSH